MDHPEAKQILAAAEADIEVNVEDGTATINGTVTIDELQAMLQLLKYTA